MAIQTINIGQQPNDGTGDPARDAFAKANANFQELDQGVSQAQGTADDAQAAADTAQNAAEEAQQTANAAQNAAEEAQQTANASIPKTEKGQPGGVAPLDDEGVVPAQHLPLADEPSTKEGVALDRVVTPAGLAAVAGLHPEATGRMPIYSAQAVPTSDVGNIWVPGIGPMQWSAAAGRYVPAGVVAPDLVADYGYASRDLNDVHDRSILARVSGQWTNGPAGQAATDYEGLLRVQASPYRVVQTLTTAAPATWTRVGGIGGGGAVTWARWSLEYGAQNIVGLVSQAGGVPTGAIIERASNANGEYVRFADGTQICWLPSVTLSFINVSTLGFQWSYPAAFVSLPASINGLRQTPPAGHRAGYIYSNASSQVGHTITLIDNEASWTADDTLIAHSFAIGRWY